MTTGTPRARRASDPTCSCGRTRGAVMRYTKAGELWVIFICDVCDMWPKIVHD